MLHSGKKYKKVLREAKRKYSEKQRLKLEDAVKSKNSNYLWSRVKSVRRGSVTPTISSENWLKHFNTVMNHPSQNRAEWHVDFNSLPEVAELDSAITHEEVFEALKSIKIWKSARP